MNLKLLWCLPLIVSCVVGYKFYQDELPNGNRVTHPCKVNYLWPGVGHKNEMGGGSRNPFGIDFAAEGHKWTTSLCNKDSDGDGKTNGVELGDPNCVWTKGMFPEVASDISHPGVCEPVDSPQCIGLNNWEFCQTSEFVCNATNETAVQKLSFIIDDTAVPAQETTYICQHFAVTTDQEYHVIAATPELDNENVMHHILLFACTGDGYTLNNPQQCGMSNGDCSTQITGWSVGQAGVCFDDNLGFRIGKNSGFSYLMIQMHWNNPQLLSTYRDHSGINIYITPKIREYDVGTLVVGQLYMDIPPGKSSHEESAACRSGCTARRLNESIYFSSVAVHMHYLGVSGLIEHYRDDKKINVLIHRPDYSYDRPEPESHSPAIEFQPGDEIKIKCEYKSTSKSTTTYYGDGTQDEMCYGFITAYPASALNRFKVCLDYEQMDMCEATNTQQVGGCIVGDYMEDMKSYLPRLMQSCDTVSGKCTAKCKEFVDANLVGHPCRQGVALSFFNSKQARRMLSGSRAIWGFDMIEKAVKSCEDRESGARKASEANTVFLSLLCASALFMKLK